MNKITTEDCKEAILEWYEDNGNDSPGDFKRIKKFKNKNGEVVRLFEHKKSNTLLKVIEKGGYVSVKFGHDLVGKGYLFSFSTNDSYKDEGNICFNVVEKSFFEEYGHLNSVHFRSQFDMPEHMIEIMESCFIVRKSTQDFVKNELFVLGFTESKELDLYLQNQSKCLELKF